MTKLQDQNKDSRALKNTVGSENYLKVYRAFFQTGAWEDHILKRPLEEAWQSYAHSQKIQPDLAQKRDNEKRDAFDSFVTNVQFGMLPPPETLLIMAEAMQKYLQGNGNISLDEAFFGRKHKKNTSYAMSFGSNHRLMQKVSLWIAAQKIGNNKTSQLNVVTKLLQEFGDDYDTDPETLLRSWRRWRRQIKKWGD